MEQRPGSSSKLVRPLNRLDSEMKNHELDKIDGIMESAIHYATKSAISYVENGMNSVEAYDRAFNEACEKAYQKMEESFPFEVENE